MIHIKLIIDIDDKVYTRVVNGGVYYYNDILDMALAIRRGTQIFKGGEHIDCIYCRSCNRNNTGNVY